MSIDLETVVTCVTDPDLDIRLGPRPYLHPIRTLGGTTVTDALCHDHPWHLGASVALQDVNNVNFWGGRTYVRDKGYTWLDDHGRVTPDLEWQDRSGRVLLTERRTIQAREAEGGWQLLFAYDLSAPPGTDIVLGSPATNGRPGGAGYGGFFWRGAAGTEALAWTEDATGEENVNGSAADWLAVRVDDTYTLTFRGLQGQDRWFVRTGEYVGVCAALAFEHPLTIAAGTTLSRRISVVVADGTAGPPSPPRTRTAAHPALRPAVPPR